MIRTFLSILISGFSLLATMAAPPDLTLGEPIDPELKITINLGATGLRGWVYYEKLYTTESRQIQVRQVDAGSPADGIILVDDLILGASGDGTTPGRFTDDARKSLAHAIAEAEARSPAVLKLLRWRSGVETTVDLTLRTMGAYSSTAPYSCPKSAKILQEGIDYMYENETVGRYSFGGLSLLAVQDASNPNRALHMAKAQAEARALILSEPAQARLKRHESQGKSLLPWEMGHQLVFLTEYYLQTNDTSVLPTIEAIAIYIAKGLNFFGTTGHSFSTRNPDGSHNGPLNRGYGAVNSAALPCLLGLLLAQECGVIDPSIEKSVTASTSFFSYYAHKGVIPYGEHIPGENSHESNGKSGLAAICFQLDGERKNARDYFAKAALASGAREREDGHTGSFFNYLWAPLGAAVGGQEAASNFFQDIKWMLDLNRTWEGEFAFDSYTKSRKSTKTSWEQFQMSTACLLTYALPLEKLYITGKNKPVIAPLNSQDIQEAIEARNFTATGLPINDLISALGSWSTPVQLMAAQELGKQEVDSVILAQIEALANNPSSTSRYGAIRALGEIRAASSGTTLFSLLTDSDNYVRYLAAQAFRFLPYATRWSYLNPLLSLVASEAKPYQPINEEDPLQFAHGELVKILFQGGNQLGHRGIISRDLDGVDRNLLYPAIRAVANSPLGTTRSLMRKALADLTEEDVNALAGVIVDMTLYQAPADKMFSGGIRVSGMDVLQKFNIAEGVPIAMELAADHDLSWGGFREMILEDLANYGGSSLLVQPNRDVIAFCQLLVDEENMAAAQAVIDAINADASPTTPRPLKTLHSITPAAAEVTLPVNQVSLKAIHSDLAGGDSQFSWSKLSGPSEVLATPNGDNKSDNTTLFFKPVPGVYEFETVMSDSRALTEERQTVSVTVRNPDGSLPPNLPPVANDGSFSTARGTPVQMVLPASDPEGFPLSYTITAVPAGGTLTGTAPHLLYSPRPSFSGVDQFTYQAKDSQGITASGSIQVEVTTQGELKLAIYEPFDYDLGELNGQSGTSEVGLDGSWEAGADNKITATSLSVAGLHSIGGKLSDTAAGSNRYGGSRPILDSALKDNGLLEDGAELWFSLNVGYDTGANMSNAYFCLALASSNFNRGGYEFWIEDEGTQLGEGLGIHFGKISHNGQTTAVQLQDESQGRRVSGRIFGTINDNRNAIQGHPHFTVGKIVWGAIEDTVELYKLDANHQLIEPPVSVLYADVDQTAFDTLTYRWGGKIMLDEIRFGPSLQSVIAGMKPLIADLAPPTPIGASFYADPASVSSSSITMTATPSYDPSGVEYYFTCVSGGGNDSGWQNSNVYIDTGLNIGVTYEYSVRVRDKSAAQNETSSSDPVAVQITNSTVVPDLVGLSESSAADTLDFYFLNLGRVTYLDDEVILAGNVSAQDPRRDTSAPSGSLVDIVVSEGVLVTEDYITWEQEYSGADLSSPLEDADRDGRTNYFEYLFGLDPTNSASAEAILTPLNKDGIFTYQRRDPALTGKSYEVLTSSQLTPTSWTQDSGAYQMIDTTTLGANKQIVTVQLSANLSNEPRFFIRVYSE